MKFVRIDVLLTDDEGYLALKGLLPEGSIVWSRNVNNNVIVKLNDSIDLSYIEKNLNSLHRVLNI